jgi:hypothetical protein
VVQLINILKNHYSKKRSPSKLKIHDGLGITVPASVSPYLKPDEDGFYQPTRFEFHVYKKMYYAIDVGTLFCSESISYKSLKDDLVSDDILETVEEMAKKYGYPKIPIYCDQRLDELEKLAHETWLNTNENIASGKNTGIRIED